MQTVAVIRHFNSTKKTFKWCGCPSSFCTPLFSFSFILQKYRDCPFKNACGIRCSDIFLRIFWRVRRAKCDARMRYWRNASMCSAWSAWRHDMRPDVANAPSAMQHLVRTTTDACISPKLLGCIDNGFCVLFISFTTPSSSLRLHPSDVDPAIHIYRLFLDFGNESEFFPETRQWLQFLYLAAVVIDVYMFSRACDVGLVYLDNRRPVVSRAFDLLPLPNAATILD